MIYNMIMELTLTQQRMLLSLLGGEEGPDIGVREPRHPSPESPGDEIAVTHNPNDVTWDWRLG